MKRAAFTPAPSSFRALILIGALAAPILLWPRASFAYLPAPLTPVYMNTSYDPMYGCGDPYYYVSTSLTNSCGHFVGYAYMSQVDGTSPVWLNTSIDDYGSCGYRYYYISASQSNSCAQFIGYLNTTQVSGTSPVYLNQSSDDYGCQYSNYYISTSSSNWCSQFIGYAYLALPPPTNYTVFPKFYIGSVIYMPPGQGSSITYGAGTVTGSTVSTTSSWKNESSWSVSIGIASITFGDNFGGQTKDSVDVQETVTTNTTYKPGTPFDQVNHDYDEIRIFLGVKVNASVDYLGNVAWGLDFSQVASQGFAETGYGITVGCLRPNSTIPSDQCAETLNFLSFVGITSSDYPSILGADPFADPNASPIPDPSRYVVIDSMEYLRDPSGKTIAYSETNSSKKTNEVTTSYGYSVGAGVTKNFGGEDGKDGKDILKVSDTFTWSYSSTRSNLTGSTGSSSFSLSMPSFTYTGPNTMFVYLDTIFKTFMFSVIPPECMPTDCATRGDNCGTIPDGCGGTLNCGSCSGYQTCGGGGAANVCGCTPTTCTAQGKNCGSIANGCGGTLSCGSCSGYQTCGGGGTANVCGCTPTNHCGGACGVYASDGCGGSVYCGACACAPKTCPRRYVWDPDVCMCINPYL